MFLYGANPTQTQTKALFNPVCLDTVINVFTSVCLDYKSCRVGGHLCLD